MSELRFQCVEVEKMQRAREGLLETNSILLGKMASARHGVHEMARRSHLLQRIIYYMKAKARGRESTAETLVLSASVCLTHHGNQTTSHEESGTRPGVFQGLSVSFRLTYGTLLTRTPSVLSHRGFGARSVQHPTTTRVRPSVAHDESEFLVCYPPER